MLFCCISLSIPKCCTSICFSSCSWRLWRWLKGSNVNFDVISPCFGIWVNWWGLVYSSLGYTPVMRSPASWSFSLLSSTLSWWPLSRTCNTKKGLSKREKKERQDLGLSIPHTLLCLRTVAHGSSLPSAVSVWTSVYCKNTSHRPALARHAELRMKGINKDITLKW